MKPLVSILIPAYNSEQWIAATLASAIRQTWPCKEVIVVDDGSRDNTAEIARKFESSEVKIVSTENQGSAEARNHALKLSQGEYIQWLDADDLLAPRKVETQMNAALKLNDSRVLLSGPWAFFNFRTDRARFEPTSLWQDLSPVEWMLRKLNENVHMQTGTWLTSRELSDAAGPWDARLASDDDGEYYCRVLLAAKRTHFVPDARVYYRNSPAAGRVSYIGTSDKKKDAMCLSMLLHVQYIRTLEDSDRVRKACLRYLQNWSDLFYPERPDLVDKLQSKAVELGGRLERPHLRWKYAWLEPILGWKAAKRAQLMLPLLRSAVTRGWDKALFKMSPDKSLR